MKKFFTLVFILSLLAVLVGCGKDNTPTVDWIIFSGKYSVAIPQTWERVISQEDYAGGNIPDDTDRIYIRFSDRSNYANYTDATIEKLLESRFAKSEETIDTMVEKHKTRYGNNSATSVMYNIESTLEGDYAGKKVEIIERQDVLETTNGLLEATFLMIAGKGSDNQDESLNAKDQFIDRKKSENYIKMYENVLASITVRDN